MTRQTDKAIKPFRNWQQLLVPLSNIVTT